MSILGTPMNTEECQWMTKNVNKCPLSNVYECLLSLNVHECQGMFIIPHECQWINEFVNI